MNPQKGTKPQEVSNKAYTFPPRKQTMSSLGEDLETKTDEESIQVKSKEDKEVPKNQCIDSNAENNNGESNTASKKSFSERLVNMMKAPFHFIFHLLPAIGDAEEMDQKMLEEALRVGAYNIVQLIIPVSLCMALVVTFQLAIAVRTNYPSRTVIYGILSQASVSGSNALLIGLVNAAIFIILIIVSTIILILLFKYRCYKAITAWLLASSALLVFIASSTYFVEILRVRMLVIDWFTLVFCVWNYGSLAIIVIHWKGPLRVQQAYLIMNSAVVAIILIRFLPEWSTWLILAFLSIYDIVAVLCPKGPLRILMEMAKERGELNLPSLIYSSTMIWTVGMADVNKKTNGDKKTNEDKKTNGNNLNSSTSKQITPKLSDICEKEQDIDEVDPRHDEPPIRINTGFIGPMPLHPPPQGEIEEDGEDGSESSQDEEKRGFKIGLGDLVFYSVLVGRAAIASEGDWLIIMSCFVAILMGLCLTSLILGIVRRALPALPISIFFGLAFYFASQYIMAPYVQILNVNQVFL